MARSRKKPKPPVAGVIAGQPVTICDGDQCVRAVKMPASTSSTLPFGTQNDEPLQQPEKSYLASILPRDYFEAMIEAAKYGFLYAFIASTPVEFFNRHFKSSGMTANQIYYAKQAIRATAYLGLSVYLGFLDLRSMLFAIGAPVSSALLKYQGSSELVAQIAPAGAAAALQIATDLSHYGKTILSLMAGIGGTLLGNHLAQKAYSWTSAGLFQGKQFILSMLESEPEEAIRKAI